MCSTLAHYWPSAREKQWQRPLWAVRRLALLPWVGRRQDSQELPFGRRDQNVGHAPAAQSFPRVREIGVGTDRRWSGFHDLFGSRLQRSALEVRAPDSSEHDALLVHHDMGRNAPVEFGEWRIRGAGGDVALDRVEDTRRCRFGTDCPETGCKPICLPSCVIRDRVAKTFEPPRGSWAHVSEAIPAVHDDRASRIKDPYCISSQRLEGKMDRAGQMLLVVFGSGQHLDELRTVIEERQKSVPVDRARHESAPPCTRSDLGFGEATHDALTSLPGAEPNASDQPPGSTVLLHCPITACNCATDGAPSKPESVRYTRHANPAGADAAANRSS